tara:strand:+ start:707 stop:895 length:189 start_codon:yes stop_codon:yes gene_type:complete
VYQIYVSIPLYNPIENYFSALKNKLQKVEGLGYEQLKKNIKKDVSDVWDKITYHYLITIDWS